jgi:bifunctional non-homologous end joining protein LigD
MTHALSTIRLTRTLPTNSEFGIRLVIMERPRVAGVDISHPERVLFPAAGATKLDLARYYEAIAAWIVPHVVDRPLTLVRCPTGVRAQPNASADTPDCFFMKHSKVWAPSPLRRVRIREKTKLGEYLIADSLAGVIGLAQMDVLEIHTWNSRFARIEQPDRIVIDLDPGARVDWKTVVSAARLVRELLMALHLESFVKTTGGRGLHVVVPLTPKADWAECLEFARAFAETVERHDARLFTTRFAKLGRERKILVDYLRNNRTNTSIAAYSTRAKPDAPVSVPLAWNELLPARHPDRFTIESVPPRLARLRTDPWRAYWTTRQTIPRAARRALDRLD